MVKITPSALSKVKDEVKPLVAEGKNPFVRLTMGIGWGGPKLHLALEESASDNDLIMNEDGIQFLISEKDSVYFNNVKIDYIRTLLGDGQFQVLHV